MNKIETPFNFFTETIQLNHANHNSDLNELKIDQKVKVIVK